jgi:hypothetical protein
LEFNEAIALADDLEDMTIQNLSASTRIGGKFDLVTVAIDTAYAPVCNSVSGDPSVKHPFPNTAISSTVHTHTESVQLLILRQGEHQVIGFIASIECMDLWRSSVILARNELQG